MRFYNPTPVDYMSTFVDNSLPYDMMLKAGLAKDKAIDDKLGEINALEQYLNIEGLPVDTKEIEEYKKNVNSLIDPLRSINYNSLLDPVTQRKIIESTRNIKNIHSGAIKAYGTRKQLAEAELKEIDKITNPTQQKFLKEQWNRKYFDPRFTEKSAKFNPKTGEYEGIDTPDYFNYKDKIDQDLFGLAKDVESDKIFSAYKAKDFDDFTKRWVEGTVETRDFDKILNSLYGYMQTPEVAKTLAVERAVNYGDNFDKAFQEESQPFIKIKNKKGEEILIPNPNTLSGQKVRSAIEARITRKEDFDSDFIKDDFKLYKAKQNDKEARDAVSTNIVTYGTEGDANFVKMLPGSLSSFYNSNGELNLETGVPVDKITFTSTRVVYPTDDKNPAAVKYAKALIETAKSITGMSDAEFSNTYKNQGFDEVKKFVESYYQDISLRKNQFIELPSKDEERNFTDKFIGVGKESNYKLLKGKITDINGKLVNADDADINSSNSNIAGFDYSKPGQLVVLKNDQENYTLQTNNQDLIRLTKDASDIHNKILKYLTNPTDYKKDQKIDSRTIRYNNKNIAIVETFAKRNENGLPIETIVVTESDNDKISTNYYTLEEFEKMNSNKVLKSNEFKSQAQKERKEADYNIENED